MKKTLAFILAVALLCIMAVGTTLTYFTDTDFDKNTMTVGKVEIIQNETDRTGAALDADSLKLYPVTGAPAADGLVPVANNGVVAEFDAGVSAICKNYISLSSNLK